jgi:hypothetical protein
MPFAFQFVLMATATIAQVAKVQFVLIFIIMKTHAPINHPLSNQRVQAQDALFRVSQIKIKTITTFFFLKLFFHLFLFL